MRVAAIAYAVYGCFGPDDKQEVAAGEAIALSGNAGYTSGPHLHFDAVDILPQESESAQRAKQVLCLPGHSRIARRQIVPGRAK